MTTKKIPVGSKVKTTGYWRENADPEDAYFGIHQTAIVLENDGENLTYRVEFDDNTNWYYYEEEIEEVTEEINVNDEEKFHLLRKEFDDFLKVCSYYLKDLRETVDGYDSSVWLQPFAFVVDEFASHKLDGIRKTALAKLTEEEKKALGL